MSGDLISRKAVIDLIESCHVFEDACCLVDYINELPAAYDVDKVVEKLVFQTSGLTTWAEDEAYKLGLTKAIEIVKSGGID